MKTPTCFIENCPQQKQPRAATQNITPVQIPVRKLPLQIATSIAPSLFKFYLSPRKQRNAFIASFKITQCRL